MMVLETAPSVEVCQFLQIFCLIDMRDDHPYMVARVPGGLPGGRIRHQPEQNRYNRGTDAS